MSEAALSRVAGTYVIVLLYVRLRAILSAMAAISATRLRQNLYNILDSVVDTGVPVEVERRGRLLRIVPEKRASKWNRLTAHKIVVGDPDELVHMDLVPRVARQPCTLILMWLSGCTRRMRSASRAWHGS